MLLFLIGLVLLFSTVQNNCDGATLEELVETDKDGAIRQGRQAGAGAPPPLTPCTTAADCPAKDTGCLFRGVGASGWCEICALAGDSFVTSYDGCGSSGGGGNATTICTTGSECPKKNGCAVPSGSTQGSCVDCSTAPTLTGQGMNVDGCSSGSGGNGTGGSGTNCTSASECTGLPGGPYGCGKITSPNSPTTQMCIPCANGGNAPTKLKMTLDGCSSEQGGGAQGLNTISSYVVLLGFLILLNFAVSHRPVLSLTRD